MTNDEINALARTIADATQNATILNLIDVMVEANKIIAQRASGVMVAMGESHPMFGIAVQVEKDARNASGEAFRTGMFADDIS